MQSHSRRVVIIAFLTAAFCVFFIVEPHSKAALKRSFPQLNRRPWGAVRTEDQLPLTPEATQIFVDSSNYTRRLIISKRKRDDVSWIDEHVPALEKTVYTADDPTATHHPPENKGNEVMSYLSYIIDHYDALSDISIFMHAHRQSWHNNDLLDNDAAQILQRLNLNRVIREGYMNLRCQWGPGCPHWLRPKSDEHHMNKQEQLQIGKVWRALFPSEPVPDVLSQACCGQFAVSREAIQRQPLERYVQFRQWVLETELSDYVVGRCFEYLWQFIFTGRHEVCPSQHVCHCDGYGICFAGEHAFQKWFEVRYNLKQRVKEVEAWHRADHEWTEAHSNGTWAKLSNSERLKQPKKESLAALELEMKDLREELDIQRLVAMRRGDDPKIRAAECGRTWKEGDGF